MSRLDTWLDQHTAHAPVALAARARTYVSTASPQRPVSDALVEGARRALASALAQPGDRSTALDLLAGDALITLALLARAEESPEQLGGFAQALLRSEHLTL